MPWSERQAALLGGMGLRLWAPPALTATADGHPPAVDLRRPPPQGDEQSGRAPLVHEPAAAVREVPPDAAMPLARQGDQPPTRPPGVGAGRADVAALDWSALRQAVADCRACDLCHRRKQTVFGSGHRQAQWLLVGEAPGEQEDEQGLPFVGAAGQLLDRMLAALGLTRAEDGAQPPSQRVYIANTLKCRPPRNRNPTADELASCEPFLARQVELLRPRLILALGRYAVNALLRSDEPIGRLRGRVHQYEGVPVIVSYHPAYLLRSPHEKAKAWEDLCLAASVFEAEAAR